MRRKSFLKRGAQSEEVSLQITSMADIFMILLVFLLKSLSSGTIEIVPSTGLDLPHGNTDDRVAQAVKVEVGRSAVLVEGHPAARIQNFGFPSGDVTEGGISRSLLSAFEQERTKEGALARGSESREADPRIVLIADQRAPYQTIKTVLASAAQEGYTDVKLAVVHDD